MRNMSYRLTKRQFLDGSKDITRRDGWAFLKAGEHYTGVEKSQGLKKGEKIVYLGQCICISNEPERVDEIIKRPIRSDQFPVTGRMRTEMEREGFPDMSAEEFVEWFCDERDLDRSDEIQRIRFEHYNSNGNGRKVA